jgi:hypothetical protein
MKTLGQLFKEKLLSEAKTAADASQDEEDSAIVAARQKYEDQLGDLLQSFPAKQQKAIITLMINLGVPINSIMLHKSDVRKNMDAAADLYVNSSIFRTWSKKLLAALATASEVQESVVDKRLSSKYQHAVYHVVKALGLPDSAEKTNATALVSGIKAVAMIAVKNSAIRKFIMALADQLGVSDKVRAMSEPKELEESFITEDIDAAIDQVTSLLTTLGLDTESSRPLKSQMKTMMFRSRMTKLSSNTTLLRKMGMLDDLIARLLQVAGETEEESGEKKK